PARQLGHGGRTPRSPLVPIPSELVGPADRFAPGSAAGARRRRTAATPRAAGRARAAGSRPPPPRGIAPRRKPVPEAVRAAREGFHARGVRPWETVVFPRGPGSVPDR